MLAVAAQLPVGALAPEATAGIARASATQMAHLTDLMLTAKSPLFARLEDRDEHGKDGRRLPLQDS
jgi:hypothetical protein